MMETREHQVLAAEASELVHRTAQLLDLEDLQGWLALIAPGGRYQVRVESAELRQSVAWWNAERDALEKTLAEVHRHVRDRAQRLRVLGQPVRVADEQGLCFSTSFAIYRTLPDGMSSLYAVGRYEDTLVRAEDGSLRYFKHVAALQTRVLGALTHLPL